MFVFNDLDIKKETWDRERNLHLKKFNTKGTRKGTLQFLTEIIKFDSNLPWLQKVACCDHHSL